MYILGVTFDEKSLFSDHAKTLAVKTSTRLSVLCRVKELAGQDALLMSYKTQER